MDLFSLGFLLIILVASGGIAYAADKLGKKLGKKRLSVFGLRPKHVATLGTVIMGVSVSFLTVLVIAAASRDARIWLIRGRGLIVERDRLLGDVRELKLQSSGLNREIEGYRSRLDAEQVRFKSLQKRASGLTSKVESLNAQIETKSDEYNRLQSQLTETRSQLFAVRAQLPIIRARASEARARYVKTNKLLNKATASLLAVKTNLRNTTNNLNFQIKRQNEIAIKSVETSVKAQELERRVADLTSDVKTRQDQLDFLQSQTTRLAAERDEAEQNVKNAQAKLTALQGQLNEAGARMVQLQEFAQNQWLFLDSTFRSSRLEPMTFRAGEEVARVVVPAGANEDSASLALNGLLRAARIEATTRGAKGHKANGETFQPADVFDRKDPRTNTTVTAETLKRAVVARIARSDEEQALVATSSYNSFTGEAVSLDIAVVPNPVVYHSREMVAEARIDGSLTEDQILSQLSEFMRSRVRERAMQDRMIPKAGSAAPFGEVPPGDVLALVRDVKRIGRSVRVQALAESDIRAADPLRLDFRIK